jgi:hypothetical protein
MWDTIHDEVVPSSARLAPPNLGDPPLEPLARHTRVGADDEVTHLLSQVPPDAQHLDVVAHSYRVVQLFVGVHFPRARERHAAARAGRVRATFS